MSQSMPVLRTIYWPALIEQAIAIGLLGVGLHAVRHHTPWDQNLFIAAMIYLIWCRVLRARLCREHRAGIRAYRAGSFRDAISHFEASRQFFSAHPQLDRWRSLILGVASRNSYRLIAIGNSAYCYGQLGEGSKAIELYEQVLRESPDNLVALSSLRMLKAGQESETAGPPG